MKILLATDGSPCSEAAVQEVSSRSWPPDTEVEVVSVAHTAMPALIPDPFMIGLASHLQAVQEYVPRARERAAVAARKIQEKSPHLRVSTQVLEDSPAKVIVEEAERWGADLIVLGSHGHGTMGRLLLGSVSHAVALHAPCSVEIVRPPQRFEESARAEPSMSSHSLSGTGK